MWQCCTTIWYVSDFEKRTNVGIYFIQSAKRERLGNFCSHKAAFYLTLMKLISVAMLRNNRSLIQQINAAPKHAIGRSSFCSNLHVRLSAKTCRPEATGDSMHLCILCNYAFIYGAHTLLLSYCSCSSTYVYYTQTCTYNNNRKLIYDSILKHAG